MNDRTQYNPPPAPKPKPAARPSKCWNPASSTIGKDAVPRPRVQGLRHTEHLRRRRIAKRRKASERAKARA